MNKLLKVILIVCLISSGNSYAAGGGTSANSPMTNATNSKNQSRMIYTVIPFDHFQEVSNLPPQLKVTFQLRCSQKFIRIVRNDEVESNTGKVTIAVGALVREDQVSPCESAQDITVDAGSTFSGLEYEVVAIQS